jgi:DNA-binding CsgD family transcriptional regulator/tetratricopeptide (TPR) repeat protein
MILERESELATLTRLLAESTSSGGRVVLVRGEAGIGKSTLITRFLSDSRNSAHTLVGGCDDLLTPQPFGPIWDMARTDASLSQPLAGGDPRAVMEAVLDLLSRSLRPTVVVLEDTQWADEATLDLIRFLGRRIARTNGLLVLTYRDIEVDSDHPLRRVIGELPPSNIVRMPLRPLSAASVTSMIETGSFNPDEVLALTGGNPLFVTEVLASGTEAVPLSVRDAVLARASKLTADARRVLDLVSIVPGEAESSLVAAIVGPTQDHLNESERQGLLRVDGDTLSFPHDLQRRAIESSLNAPRRRDLNQAVLDALGEAADPARLVHHAREAGNVDAIVRFAPRAAKAAMAIESTTEAVAHFRTLEPYIDRLPSLEQAAILADWATEEYYLDDPASVELFDRAIDLYRHAGDQRSLARTLTMAGRVNRSFARPEESLDQAIEAVSILEPFGPSPELARALSFRALLEWIYSDEDAVILKLANQAMSLAELVDDEEALMYALILKGNLIYSHGDMRGMALVDESLRHAEHLGNGPGQTAALVNMAGMSGDVRDVERAIDFARRARETAARYEIRSTEVESQALLSEFLLWKGDWAAAENAAGDALGSNPTIEALAWRVLGTIQARRGRSEAGGAIRRMWSLASPAEGLTVVDTAAAALAEYLWLSGDGTPEEIQGLKDVLAEGLSKGTPWPSGALAFWMWKLDLLDAVPDGTADFYGWIIKGEYERSAEFWRARSIPYEEGLALMHGRDSEQIRAIRIFEKLGATATANRVRRDLVDHGVNVPRGRSRSTRDHLAGLTARQAEVLDLLAREMTNTEIADELFVSYRTVENHVSAILMKLDVASREAAVEAGRNQGILAAD